MSNNTDIDRYNRYMPVKALWTIHLTFWIIRLFQILTHTSLGYKTSWEHPQTWTTSSSLITQAVLCSVLRMCKKKTNSRAQLGIVGNTLILIKATNSKPNRGALLFYWHLTLLQTWGSERRGIIHRTPTLHLQHIYPELASGNTNTTIMLGVCWYRGVAIDFLIFYDSWT